MKSNFGFNRNVLMFLNALEEYMEETFSKGDSAKTEFYIADFDKWFLKQKNEDKYIILLFLIKISERVDFDALLCLMPDTKAYCIKLFSTHLKELFKILLAKSHDEAYTNLVSTNPDLFKNRIKNDLIEINNLLSNGGNYKSLTTLQEGLSLLSIQGISHAKLWISNHPPIYNYFLNKINTLLNLKAITKQKYSMILFDNETLQDHLQNLITNKNRIKIIRQKDYQTAISFYNRGQKRNNIRHNCIYLPLFDALNEHTEHLTTVLLNLEKKKTIGIQKNQDLPQSKHFKFIDKDFRAKNTSPFTFEDIINVKVFKDFENNLFENKLINAEYNFINKYGNKKKIATIYHVLISNNYFLPKSFKYRKGFENRHYRKYLDNRYNVATNQEFKRIKDEDIISLKNKYQWIDNLPILLV